MRDTRGETIAETAVNKLKNRLPGLSKTLPAKVNVFGEDVKIDNPTIWNVFANPAIASAFKKHPGAELVLDLYARSGGYSKGFPRVVDAKSITYEGSVVPLSRNEQLDYQRVVGKKVVEGLDALAQLTNLNQLDPVALSDWIARDILGPAREFGKMTILQKLGAPEILKRIAKAKEEGKRK